MAKSGEPSLQLDSIELLSCHVCAAICESALWTCSESMLLVSMLEGSVATDLFHSSQSSCIGVDVVKRSWEMGSALLQKGVE